MSLHRLCCRPKTLPTDTRPITLIANSPVGRVVRRRDYTLEYSSIYGASLSHLHISDIDPVTYWLTEWVSKGMGGWLNERNTPVLPKVLPALTWSGRARKSLFWQTTWMERERERERERGKRREGEEGDRDIVTNLSEWEVVGSGVSIRALCITCIHSDPTGNVGAVTGVIGFWCCCP